MAKKEHLPRITVPCGHGLVAKSCPTLVTSWTVAHQASLPMEFSRQEYWSGLSFPAPRNLSDPEIRTASLASPLLYCSVQLLSCVRLFVTPWTAAWQASMSILELTQTHVHRVHDAIQPSQPLSSPSPPAFNLSQHQGLLQ